MCNFPKILFYFSVLRLESTNFKCTTQRKKTKKRKLWDLFGQDQQDLYKTFIQPTSRAKDRGHLSGSHPRLFAMFVCFCALRFPLIVPPLRGGTHLYRLYRYARPQRLWFFSRFGHKLGVDFSHFPPQKCFFAL